ncbi:uncharacterized shell protein 6-like [Crassostrea angulata]|uniref:uncharacterized shell protein 6-like n=1 Tax=Magallana angulata TaxID=2784310 RepID=UPI0022B19442|nr:uncharacterized shell protein 6-like [Crassostrea angulata]
MDGTCRTLTVFLILALCASTVYPCRCNCNDVCICDCEFPAPTNGCKADFSLRGAVLTEKVVTVKGLLKREYIIDVLQYYKKPKGVRHQVRLITPLHTASCGVPLKLGEIYVLSGKLTGKLFQTDQCQYNRLYSSVPIFQREHLFC